MPRIADIVIDVAIWTTTAGAGVEEAAVGTSPHASESSDTTRARAQAADFITGPFSRRWVDEREN